MTTTGSSTQNDVDTMDESVGRASVVFLTVAILAMLADGFDLSAIGIVAPELKKLWHIDSGQLAPMFTAGVLGLMLGAPLLGLLGDRLGRKTAILISLGIYGTLTLTSTLATSLNQFVALRFLTGVGLGGMIPNVLSLTSEMAPPRLRGMYSVIVLFGVPAGIAIPGLVAALLVPEYGWRSIFLVGGLLPLIVAALAASSFRESRRFLALIGASPELPASASRALSVSAGTAALDNGFAMLRKSGSPSRLFEGNLAIITPALWLALAANQFTNFFVMSWLPTLLQSAGMSTAHAGLSASVFSMGGLLGGLILTFVIDSYGVLPIAGLFLLGAPLIALMGMREVPPVASIVIIAAAGFCVTGNNFAMNAAMVMIYPTPVRSTGTGWAQAMGRLGSLAAPILGGTLLAMHLTQQQLYLAPAFALLLGGAAAGVLIAYCVRRYGGYRLRDTLDNPPGRYPADVVRGAE